MFDVSVTIPDLGGDNAAEGAETFWAVLDEYREGGLGTIFIDVRETGGKHLATVELDPVSGKAVQS